VAALTGDASLCTEVQPPQQLLLLLLLLVF
jgi:hypothetical protein